MPLSTTSHGHGGELGRGVGPGQDFGEREVAAPRSRGAAPRRRAPAAGPARRSPARPRRPRRRAQAPGRRAARRRPPPAARPDDAERGRGCARRRRAPGCRSTRSSRGSRRLRMPVQCPSPHGPTQPGGPAQPQPGPRYRRPRERRTGPRTAPAAPGAYQFQRPSSRIVAGTSSARTMVASMSTATRQPDADHLDERRCRWWRRRRRRRRTAAPHW